MFSADAVIGFVVSPSFTGSLTILPTSGVSVTAQNNVLVQGGAPSFSTGANGVIGFYTPASISSGTVTLQNVRVNSTAGDISVVGGLGTGFIGTQAPNSFNMISQSNIAIGAPQGSLYMSPSLPGGTSGPGASLIANGAIFGPSPNFPVPYDISIGVGRLVMSGVPVGSQGSGSAQIFSSRNLDVSTAGDLIMSIPSGVSSASFCTMNNALGVMTFDVGGNSNCSQEESPTRTCRSEAPPLLKGQGISYSKISAAMRP